MFCKQGSQAWGSGVVLPLGPRLDQPQGPGRAPAQLELRLQALFAMSPGTFTHAESSATAWLLGHGVSP